MKITRRFGILGQQYDYILVEMGGADSVSILTEIYGAYYTELAFMAELSGNDSLGKYSAILERVRSAADNIGEVFSFDLGSMDDVAEVPWD